MVDFKKLLEKSSMEASKLPSFPQKGVVYHINAQNPDFTTHEDKIEQENAFGKMIKRTQTVYHINTQEGILRVSPNQIQQLNTLLAPFCIDPAQTWLPIETKDSEHGLIFLLAPTWDADVKFTRTDD
jgi:hypothetical protein